MGVEREGRKGRGVGERGKRGENEKEVKRRNGVRKKGMKLE